MLYLADIYLGILSGSQLLQV